MRVFLCLGIWLCASVVAQAQLLPVPNTRNADWVLINTTPGRRPSLPDTLPGSRDRMPTAGPNPLAPTPAMPNALTAGLSNQSTGLVGGARAYWDAARQLSYAWRGPAAPDSLVTVCQQSSGASFTYRKRAKPVPGAAK